MDGYRAGQGRAAYVAVAVAVGRGGEPKEMEGRAAARGSVAQVDDEATISCRVLAVWSNVTTMYLLGS
jgi:hypothetical protein